MGWLSLVNRCRSPDGTQVSVEAVVPPGVDFWESCSLEELARRQGVSLPQPSEEMLGGWPEDELDDGFEDEVASWRKRELEQTQ
jgi:hypothetical protein